MYFKPTPWRTKRTRLFLLTVAALCLSSISHIALKTSAPWLQELPPLKELSISDDISKSMTLGRVHSHFSRACLGGVEYAAGLNLILLQEVAKACTAVDKNLSVIIAGVEFGAEIVPILNTGLHVIGFEPNPAYFAHLDAINKDRFTLVRAGVNNLAEENRLLVYHGEPFLANITTIDAVVKQSVLAIQVDTNTVDPTLVLKGAEELISRHGVALIVAEFEPHQCKELLTFLTDRGYVIFDFLWVGSQLHSNEKISYLYQDEHGEPQLIRSVHPDASGGTPISDYCEGVSEHVSKFSWLQNDVFAVHASVLTEKLISFLGSVHQFCETSVHCTARQEVIDIFGESTCMPTPSCDHIDSRLIDSDFIYLGDSRARQFYDAHARALSLDPKQSLMRYSDGKCMNNTFRDANSGYCSIVEVYANLTTSDGRKFCDPDFNFRARNCPKSIQQCAYDITSSVDALSEYLELHGHRHTVLILSFGLHDVIYNSEGKEGFLRFVDKLLRTARDLNTKLTSTNSGSLEVIWLQTYNLPPPRPEASPKFHNWQRMNEIISDWIPAIEERLIEHCTPVFRMSEILSDFKPEWSIDSVHLSMEIHDNTLPLLVRTRKREC